MGLITRKAANAATPVVTVTTDGKHWKLRQVTSFKTHEQEFDVDVEQETSTADGRKVKVRPARVTSIYTMSVK